MGAFDRLVRAGAITFATAGACVPLLSEVDRPCPCAEGFICCETTNTCRKQNECQQSRTDSSASHDPSVDGGSDASFDSSRGADDAAVSSPPDREDPPGVAPDAPVDHGVERDASTDALVERDAPPEGPIVPPVACWSEPRKSNVLVLISNPYLVGHGHSLLEEIAAWVYPRFLSVRIAEYVRIASYGLVNYDVVEFRELNAWPKQMPGAAPLDEMTFFQWAPS